MSYKLEQRKGVIYALELSAEPKEVLAEIDSIAKEIGKNAKLPGFRPGKAPVSIVKKYYQDEIKDAFVRTFLARQVGQILKDEGIEILSEPIVEELELDLNSGKFKATVLLEVKPKIDLSKEDYTGIKVKKRTRKIEDKDVEKVVEGLRNQLAVWKEVDREAKEGDLVEIEYETFVEGEEKPHKGAVSVVLGQSQLWPEVEKEVLGKKSGEEGEVEFTAGEDKSVYGEVSGKKVKVKFKVKAVKEKELPQVSDEFAKKLGFESVEEMKKKIREDLEVAEETREQEEIEEQIVDALLEKVDVPVPPSLLQLEIRAQAENQARRMAQMGFNVSQISPEALFEMVKPSAEKTVKVKLLLEKVAELEGIEVSDEEVEEEIERIAESLFGGDYVAARKSLEERNLIPLIREDIRRQKALDRLIELAEIEEVQEEEEEKAEEG